MKTNFGFGKAVDANFDDAIAQVTDELKKEGFGVLTEIDVAATLKEKLGEDMPPYRILDAPEIEPLAAQVKERLTRVMENI